MAQTVSLELPRAKVAPRLRGLADNTRLLGALMLALILGVWEAVAQLKLIDPLILPAPTAIAGAAWRVFFVTREIYPHLWVSFQELVIGFGLAVVLGVPIGLLLGRSKLCRALFEPYVMALYSTPQVAFFPLLIIALGIGLWSKVALVFFGAVFSILINTQAGVITTDRRMIEMARSFTAPELTIFRKVILPASLPFIIAGMRLGLGRALIMVFVAELFSATEGLGYFIVRAGALFDTPKLFVGVIIFTLTGVLLSEGMKRLEHRLVPWLSLREEEAS
ncbi:MAG TPA: ABC transporter permease [Chloroflexota bacterium]|jgi:ABC-type nitrate/sulfonate/bicarbonate transport system permease component